MELISLLTVIIEVQKSTCVVDDAQTVLMFSHGAGCFSGAQVSGLRDSQQDEKAIL